ncbi:hypothetical protein HY994_03095 [Candidatus Micrarchaeota archaeon]|nr:hypothetical protein [Candidatus Micrarchaeota archaeon]
MNERIGSGIFQRLKLKPNILDHFNPDPSKEADIKLAFLHILERHFQAETGMGLHHTLEELRTEMDTHYSSPHFENKFVRPLVDLGLVFLKRGKIAGSWASRLHVDPDILSAHRSE